MFIVGCDFHPSWQQGCWLETGTGETGEQKLVHASGEAKRFYGRLAGPVLIGMDATGNSQWFLELVEDLGHEIWISDAAQIRASYVRKQKTDKRDAAHILKLVVEGRFPRLWMPDREQRDLRQLVLQALVKKVVFDEVQCFPTNSTMPSGMCVKPEKNFELTRPEGAVELRANAAEGRKRGDAMGRASWHSPFLGHPGAKFYPGNAGSVQSEENR